MNVYAHWPLTYAHAMRIHFTTKNGLKQFDSLIRKRLVDVDITHRMTLQID